MPALLSPKSPKASNKTNLLSPPTIDTSNIQTVTPTIEAHAYSLGQIVYQTQGPILGVHLLNQSNNQTNKQSICIASRHSLTLISPQYFNVLQCINESILPSPISCCYYALHNQSISQTGNQSSNPIILGHDNGSITLIDPITLSVKLNKQCHDTSVIRITTTNQTTSQSNNNFIYSVDSSRTQLIVSSIKTLDRVDEYVESIGLIDCMIAEAGVVWIGLSTGHIKRLALPSRAITHILKPADVPIKQPINQLLTPSIVQSNASANPLSVTQAIKYGPIRCLYASASPPPAVKKAKKKKGEEDIAPTQSDDPTIILWSSHGFASLTSWDTRILNSQPTSQAIHQSMVLHQQRLTFDAIASVQHSYNQLQINQSINQSTKPFSPSNQMSTRSSAQSLLTQPGSINQASNQIINCMLVHDGILYTGQEDGMIGVINLSGNQSNNPLSPTNKTLLSPSAKQTTQSSNQAPRRQLVEVDAQGNDSIQHMIVVVNNEEQTTETQPPVDQPTEQVDNESVMEEKTNDDDSDATHHETKVETTQNDLVDQKPISQPTGPFCASPYLLFGTRAGQVHVVPIRSILYEVSTQTRAMTELEQQMRDAWSHAKATKASKSTRGEKKKK